MSGHSDPIDRLVRRAAAVHDDELARSWSHSRAEQALFEEITMRTIQEQTERPVPTAAPAVARWRGPARLAVAATAVVAASLGLFTAMSAGPTVDPAAAEVLRSAGTVAGAGAGPGVLADGQYWYQRTEGVSTGEGDSGRSVTRSSSCESWLAADGSGSQTCTSDTGAPETLAFPAASPADPDPGAAAVPATEGGGFVTGLGLGTYQDLLALPTEADALVAHFERELEGYDGRPHEQEMFVLVTDVLRQPAPPALRAALFEVASGIPGVELVGPTTDRLGRSGVAVAMDDESGELRDEVVIDPTTSALLAERRTLRTAVDWTDLPAGGTVSETVVVSSGIVDSPTARP